MKKLINSKPFLALATVATAAGAFAQDVTSGITADIVTPYITDGKTQMLTVLTAGAAIVGGLFVWALLKKALNRSK